MTTFSLEKENILTGSMMLIFGIVIVIILMATIIACRGFKSDKE